MVFLGSRSIDLTMQWWLDYSADVSFCEEPYVSATMLTNFWNSVDSAFVTYTDLGLINSVSVFETASQLLKVSDYPNWMHNSIKVLIEPLDGMPMDGFVYVGGETLKISGYSATIPLSRRSFLPTSFQVSFLTKRRFSVKWWAEYRGAQEVPVQMSVAENENDSVFCEYEFTSVKRKKVVLGYLKSDFSDGMPPSYTAKSLLEGVALGMSEDNLYVGTMYDIHASLASGKTITLAIPLEIHGPVTLENIVVYHDNGGVVETIPIDSVADGFVYFRTSSLSSFWSVVVDIGEGSVNIYDKIWGAVVDGAVTMVGWVSDGVNYVNDKLEDFLTWVGNNVCSVFDMNAWRDFFSLDLSGMSTDDWNLPEGTMPDLSNMDDGSLLFNSIDSMSQDSLRIIGNVMDDILRLNTTKRNLDIMLSELIRRKMGKGAIQRFRVDGYVNLVDAGNIQSVKQYMAVSTMLTDYAVEMVEMMEACYKSYNTNTLTNFLEEFRNIARGHSSAEQICKDLLGGFGSVEHSANVANCATDGIKMLTQYVDDGSTISILVKQRDELVLATTDVLVRVALLAYYDMSMRQPLRMWFNRTYKALSAILELMGPLMLYNNIAIKAEAAMALYEYVYWGTTTHFERLKLGIRLHYGEDGGFSEGMGYLQYINEDVPYLMVALKKAFAQSGRAFDMPEKFYRSGYYLKRMSRNIRWTRHGIKPDSSILVPMEVDDGCTYTPEFSVWGTLTGDGEFFDMAKKYSVDRVLQGNPLAGSPLVALGLPDYRITTNGDWDVPEGVAGAFLDGTAIINYHENSNDYTITLIGESGSMWENGQAHDQQDNMSFTLSSTRDGHLVRDMGYSGFGNDSKTRGYGNHSVLMRPNYPGWTDGFGNHALDYRELSGRAETFSHENTGLVASGTLLLSSNLLADYSVIGAGGSEAYLVDSVGGNDILGYTVYQRTLGGVFSNPLNNEEIRVEPFENYRTIAYFGKTLWLFDQPSDDDLLWVVNGSTETAAIQGSYFQEKVDVYIGGFKVNVFGDWNYLSAQQINSRADYITGNMVTVRRHAFSLSALREDNQAGPTTTVVMAYPIDTLKAFRMVLLPVNPNVQCFERTDGNVQQRVVVPIRGSVYKVKDVLPDVPLTDYSSYNGIMFAQRVGNGLWDVRLLNDGSRVNKSFVKTKFLPFLIPLLGR